MSSSSTRSKRRRRRVSPSDPAQASAADGTRVEPSVWALTWTEQAGVRELDSLKQVKTALADPGSRTWIDLENADHDLLAGLGTTLGLHPLIVEDILERNQRAKLEQYTDALHIVMFALSYEGELLSHEIDIVIGERFLLTAHDDDMDPRKAPFVVRGRGSHLSTGTDFMLWALTDWIVDGYFPVFDRLGDEIDELEADVMRQPSSWIVERLFQVRRDLLVIRHSVGPQREIFNQLTNRDSKLIAPQRIVYFRDVYDHLIRLTDELDSYRELVGTTLDIYLSQVNNNLSEIMKRLTGVTVILATIAAVSGIFGMSEAGLAFQFHEATGFWLVTIGALAIAALIYLYFRRRGWI